MQILCCLDSYRGLCLPTLAAHEQSVLTLVLTQGAAIITGLGFTGYNEEGRTLWDGAANIRVLNIEFAENFKMMIDSWNMKTNVWLRECIYKRVAKKGAKPGFKSSMMTFTVSAIWVWSSVCGLTVC